jgi:prefoldin subunit 5
MDDLNTTVSRLSMDMARVDEQIKTLFKQQAEIKALTETVQKLAMSIERQGLSLKTTDEKLDGVKQDVDEMKSKPAKRWDNLISIAISVVVTALITYVLTVTGLK